MKPSALITALIASLLALCVLAPVVSAETAAATQPTAKKQDGMSAAERRKADSKFESEKLDSAAFDKAEASKGDKVAAKKSDGGSLARMLFGLVVVLGSIFGIHWLLKKWGQNRLEGVAGKAGIIDVVATTQLAQGRALHVVRVGDELVLVGATEQSITRLGEIDGGVMSSMAGDQGKGEFQAMLSGAMFGNQPGVPAGMGGSGSGSQPFFRRFLDNLRLSTAR